MTMPLSITAKSETEVFMFVNKFYWSTIKSDIRKVVQ